MLKLTPVIASGSVSVKSAFRKREIIKKKQQRNEKSISKKEVRCGMQLNMRILRQIAIDTRGPLAKSSTKSVTSWPM